MGNSKMVTKHIPAHTSNYETGRRGVRISEIVIHHVAGNLSIEALGRMWQTVNRKVSSHYGINGKNVGQYVDEADTAWTNGNADANRRSVTIETANSGGAPDWPVSEASFETLVRLVADIAKRNGLGRLVVGKNLRKHQDYKATACPGPYLIARMGLIADMANEINEGGNTDVRVPVIAVYETAANTGVRDAPNGKWIGTAPKGVRFTATELVSVGEDVWAKHSSGWCQIDSRVAPVAVEDSGKIAELTAQVKALKSANAAHVTSASKAISELKKIK